jgi:hypothetical protein
VAGLSVLTTKAFDGGDLGVSRQDVHHGKHEQKGGQLAQKRFHVASSRVKSCLGTSKTTNGLKNSVDVTG